MISATTIMLVALLPITMATAVLIQTISLGLLYRRLAGLTSRIFGTIETLAYIGYDMKSTYQTLKREDEWYLPNLLGMLFSLDMQRYFKRTYRKERLMRKFVSARRVSLPYFTGAFDSLFNLRRNRLRPRRLYVNPISPHAEIVPEWMPNLDWTYVLYARLLRDIEREANTKKIVASSPTAFDQLRKIAHDLGNKQCQKHTQKEWEDKMVPWLGINETDIWCYTRTPTWLVEMPDLGIPDLWMWQHVIGWAKEICPDLTPSHPNAFLILKNVSLEWQRCELGEVVNENPLIRELRDFHGVGTFPVDRIAYRAISAQEAGFNEPVPDEFEPVDEEIDSRDMSIDTYDHSHLDGMQVYTYPRAQYRNLIEDRKRREREKRDVQAQLGISMDVNIPIWRNLKKRLLRHAWDETIETREFIIKLIEDSLILTYQLLRARDKQDMIMALLIFTKSMCKKSFSSTVIECTMLPTIMPMIMDMITPTSNVRAQSSATEKMEGVELYIYQARKVVTDYKSVKDSKMASKIHELITYLMAFVFAEKIDIETDNQILLKLSKKATKIREKGTYESFMFVLADTFTFICERGYAMIKDKNLMALFDENREYTKYVEKANRLVDDYAKILNPQAHNFDEHKYHSDLESCIEQGEYILRIVKADKDESKARLYSQIVLLQSKLRTTRLNYVNVLAAQCDRVAPFGICISGGSSIGKSTFATLLYYHFGKLRNKPIDSIYRFFRNPEDEYWSGFMSFMWCVHIDDAANKKPQYCKEGDKSVAEILAILNQTPYNPNQADLDKKGKTPVRAELVTVSTNIYDLNMVEYYETSLAAQRRFNFTIHLEVKPEYAKHSQFLDSSKIKVEDIKEDEFPDFWNIYVYEIRPVEGPIFKQRGKYVNIAKFEGKGAMERFLRLYSKYVFAHFESQDKALSTLKVMQEVHYCMECRNPKGMCVCGKPSQIHKEWRELRELATELRPAVSANTPAGEIVFGDHEEYESQPPEAQLGVDTFIDVLEARADWKQRRASLDWCGDNLGPMIMNHEFCNVAITHTESDHFTVFLRFFPNTQMKHLVLNCKTDRVCYDYCYEDYLGEYLELSVMKGLFAFGSENFESRIMQRNSTVRKALMHTIETIYTQLKYKIVMQARADGRRVRVITDLPVNIALDYEIDTYLVMPEITHDNAFRFDQICGHVIHTMCGLRKHIGLDIVEEFDDTFDVFKFEGVLSGKVQTVATERLIKHCNKRVVEHVDWEEYRNLRFIDKCYIYMDSIEAYQEKMEDKFHNHWLPKFLGWHAQRQDEFIYKFTIGWWVPAFLIMSTGYVETKKMQWKRTCKAAKEYHDKLFASYSNFVARQDPFVQNVLTVLPYVVAGGTLGAGLYFLYSSASKRKEKKEVIPNFAKGPEVECVGAITPVGAETVNNPWYQNNFVLTPSDLPNSVAMVSYNHQEIVHKFGSNVGLVNVKWEKEDGSPYIGKCHILFIGNHIAAVNRHCFKRFPCEVTFNSTNAIYSPSYKGIDACVTRTYQKGDVYFKENSDLAFIKVDCLPAKVDIFKYLPKDDEFDVVSNATLISREKETGSLYYRTLVDVRKCNKHYTENLEHNGPMWISSYTTPTVCGQSGSLLVLNTNYGPAVCGIHAMVDYGKEIIGSVTLTQKDFLEAKKRLSPILRPVTDGPVSVQNFEQKTMKNLSEKSVLRYIERGQAYVYGTVHPVHNSTPKSSVMNTHLREEMEKRGYTTDFVKPEFDYRPLRANIEDQCAIVHKIPVNVTNNIVECFAQHIVSNAQINKEDLSRTLTLRSAINGAVGMKFIDGMNRSTSAGFPHNKTKKNFIIADPDEMFPDGIDVTQDIIEEFKIIHKQYDNGMRYKPIFNDSLKDEPRKREKVEQGKIRVFSAAPLAFQLKVRAIFLPFIRVFQSNKFLFMSAPGTNVHSVEWNEFHKYLTAFGEDRLFDGDYKSFDKKMSCEVIRAAFAIMIRIYELAGASEQVLKHASCIAEDISCALKCNKGDIYEVFGGNPSGHPLTVIINCLANIIYLMFAYHQEYPSDKNFEEFFRKVHVMTYGDDNIVGVHNSLPKFNFNSVSKWLAKIGVVYTPADKVSAGYELKNISKCSFLKRSWLYNSDLRVYFAPLDEESIIKSLMISCKSKSITETEHARQIVRSAIVEYFQYGKEKFEAKRAELLDILSCAGVQHDQSDYPTWDDCLERYIISSKSAEIYQG